MSVSFSAVFSFVHFISTPHKFLCKSYLQKIVVNCHENLKGFQIMTVKAVEERAENSSLLAGMVIMLSLHKSGDHIWSNWFVRVN